MFSMASYQLIRDDDNKESAWNQHWKYWSYARRVLIAGIIASMRGICTRWPRWKVNNPEGNSASAPVKWKTPDSLICESYRLRHSLLISRLGSRQCPVTSYSFHFAASADSSYSRHFLFSFLPTFLTRLSFGEWMIFAGIRRTASFVSSSRRWFHFTNTWNSSVSDMLITGQEGSDK